MTKRKRDEFLFGRGCVAQHPLLAAPLLYGYDQKKKYIYFYLGGFVAQHPLLDAPLL